MQNLTRNIKDILFILGIASIIPIFLNNTFAPKYEVYNYLLLQVIIFLIAYFIKKDRIKFVLSPSFIAVSYININFILGSYVYSNGLVFTKLLRDYTSWDQYSQRMLFFNLINLSIIFAYFIRFNVPVKNFLIVNINRVNTLLFLIVTIIFFILSLVFDFGFSIVLRSLLILFILIFVSERFKIFYRIFFYTVIIFIFVLFSTDSKREAIFLLLPILLLESRRIKLTFSIKQILLSSVVAFFLLYMIIIMSILRGYGGYKVSNFFEASKYVYAYTHSSFFIPAIVNNLEITSTYLHSNNVIEYIKDDKIAYRYGETFIKPLFIIIPREYFKFKPRSAIEHYTFAYDQKFRDRGGSYPISIQSEFYLNFGWLSIIFAFIFFIFINGLYKLTLSLIISNNIINYAYLLYGYELFLSLVRGSGLDIFSVYMIFFIFFFISYKMFLKVITS